MPIRHHRMQYKALGKRIRETREEAGLTQVEFGERLGYFEQTQISRIEKGERRVDIFELFDIASVLKVSVDTLLPADRLLSRRRRRS